MLWEHFLKILIRKTAKKEEEDIKLISFLVSQNVGQEGTYSNLTAVKCHIYNEA